MFGPVHGDEHRQQIVAPDRLALAENGDAAERVGGGEDVGERLDLHDVGMAGHRPIGSELAFRAEVDRILGAQPREQGREAILLPELGPTDVDLFERKGAFIPCLRGHSGSLHWNRHRIAASRRRR
jgi:hypothetical protein